MENTTLVTLLCFFQLVPSICIMYFAFYNRFRFSRFVTACVCLGFVLITLFGIALYDLQFTSSNWNNTNSALFMIVIVLLCLYFVKGDLFQILFVLFLLETYADDLLFFSKVWAGNEAIAGYRYISPSFICALLITVVCSFPLVLAFVVKLVRPLIDSTEYHSFWKYMWMVPASFYLIYRPLIQEGLLNSIQDGTNIQFMPFIWAVGTFLTYFAIIKMFSEAANNSYLKEQLRVMDTQLDIQAEKYEKLSNNIEETRRQSHDLRHHLTVMRGYLTSKDYGGLEQYLNQYQETVESAEDNPYCENYAIDSIVRYHLTIAKRKNIQTQVQIAVPKTLPFPDTDIGIILGNLLENAVEACSRQKGDKRFIKIKIGMTGINNLTILISNSFDGNLQEKEGTFFSSKRSGEGIGIHSVQVIAHKYNGVTRFEHSNSVFRVSVFLNASKT